MVVTAVLVEHAQRRYWPRPELDRWPGRQDGEPRVWLGSCGKRAGAGVGPQGAARCQGLDAIAHLPPMRHWDGSGCWA